MLLLGTFLKPALPALPGTGSGATTNPPGHTRGLASKRQHHECQQSPKHDAQCRPWVDRLNSGWGDKCFRAWSWQGWAHSHWRCRHQSGDLGHWDMHRRRVRWWSNSRSLANRPSFCHSRCFQKHRSLWRRTHVCHNSCTNGLQELDLERQHPSHTGPSSVPHRDPHNTRQAHKLCFAQT